MTAAAAERSTNAAGSVEEEEDEASRVDLYGALNVETTATSIEVRFCFFPLYFFFVKPMRHAREECIVFYVASPSRLFSATRDAGEMTRTASVRAGGREEREREAERFFRFPLDENRESEKPNWKRAFFSRRRRSFCWYSFRTLLREGDVLIALTSFAFSHSLFPKNRFAERTGT